MRRREQLRAIRHQVRATRTGRITVKAIIALIGAIVVTVGIILIPFGAAGYDDLRRGNGCAENCSGCLGLDLEQ